MRLEGLVSLARTHPPPDLIIEEANSLVNLLISCKLRSCPKIPLIPETDIFILKAKYETGNI
jgi:hypothetical protein